MKLILKLIDLDDDLGIDSNIRLKDSLQDTENNNVTNTTPLLEPKQNIEIETL